MKDLIQNNRLIAFTLLTYLISWVSWLSIMDGLEENIFASSAVTLVVFFIGGYGPTLAAIVLSLYLGGVDGLKALLRKFVLWRVGFKWYLLALVVGPIIYSLAVAIFVLTGGDVGEVNYGLIPWIPIVFVVPIIFGPLAEELGWRGFALPSMDSINKPILASIVIGLIWGAWHMPLFWAVTGTAISGFPITLETVTLFLLMTVGFSFIYTLLYKFTSGSVLIAIMLHLSANGSGIVLAMFFPDLSAESKQLIFTYHIGVLWVLVLCLGIFSFVSKTSEDTHLNTEKPV